MVLWQDFTSIQSGYKVFPHNYWAVSGGSVSWLTVAFQIDDAFYLTASFHDQVKLQHFSTQTGQEVQRGDKEMGKIR